MTIERLHQEIKFRWNKMNSNHKKDFSSAYLDDAINKATDDFIEIFYSGNNSKQYKFGFEVNQQRIDMLQTLIVPEESIPVELISTDKYKINLSDLSESYRHFLRASVTSTDCDGNVIPVNIVRLNDLDSKLNDKFTQPSLNWKRCLGSIKNNTLELYTKDYTITECNIEYLRNPVKVFYGGYDSLEFINGDTLAYQSGSSKVTSDLPPAYHDLLVDMVVQYLSIVLEDQSKFQLQQQELYSKT